MTRIFGQQCGDAIELRRDEAGAAQMLLTESGDARGVVDDIAGLRIGIERGVGYVAAGEVGRKAEQHHRRTDVGLDEGLPRLSQLRAGDAELVLRDKEERADATAGAGGKDPAIEEVGYPQRLAQRFEIVPTPDSFLRVVNRQRSARRGVHLRTRQRRAASRRYCRVAG